ncbi:MAG: hypothetical protein JO345_37130, partial [Streptosporangiaceae bacterium]|nr:hypothetical protein [Streptosporangiaceae bacterium]
RWMVWLLDNYSDAYASNQYRALQQFFRWWSAEEDLPDPFARLHPPKVRDRLPDLVAAQPIEARLPGTVLPAETRAALTDSR